MSIPRPEYKQLADDQLREFDTDYFDGDRWAMIHDALDRSFGSSAFSFLDVGGGNGLLADRILDRYPRASGTLVDNSKLLLDRNIRHPRKSVVHASAHDIGDVFRGRTFDVIFFNWILHHLVSSSYGATLESIRACILGACSLLSERGRISIMENSYNGLIVDSAPGWLIFHLTSSRRMSRVIGALGANTAGVGVCFLAKRSWMRLLSGTGVTVEHSRDDRTWATSPLRRAALHIRSVHVTHFWCRR